MVFLVTFLYVFLVNCYIFWSLAPPRGITLGQWYHALKGLAPGKYHTKFQLSSPKGMKVISCKRNTDVKLHLNLQVNLNLVTNMTYAHRHVHTYGSNITAKRYMPHSCLRQVGAYKIDKRLLTASKRLTLSPLSFWSGLICPWTWTCPLMQIDVSV